MRLTFIAATLLLTVGCTETPEPTNTEASSVTDSPTTVSNDAVAPTGSTLELEKILGAQPAEVQARYSQRHPLETLEFIGITPGMTVVEALPGGGWYSKLLLPYLGSSGSLIGADYPLDLWPNFSFADEAFLANKSTWITTWPQTAETWRSPQDASVGAFVFGDLPASKHNSADAVLLIRALHNLARFSDPTSADKNFLQQTLADTFSVLKPGGIVGVVQHQAPQNADDSWADGSAGYLKKSFVIKQMELAGFEYVASSNINENSKDQPTSDDIVWRLPPSYATSQNNPELKATMDAIGESKRMTLKFIKPAT